MNLGQVVQRKKNIECDQFHVTCLVFYYALFYKNLLSLFSHAPLSELSAAALVVGPTWSEYVILAVAHLKMEHVGEAKVLFQFYVKLVTNCRLYVTICLSNFYLLFMYVYFFPYLPVIIYHQYLSFPDSVSFMHLCSPVTSLCFCEIWAWARPSLCLSLFGHFRIPSIFWDFVRFSFSWISHCCPILHSH